MDSILHDSCATTTDRAVPEQIQDLYPSRSGVGGAISTRLDPVVYADSDTASPINPALVKQYEEQGFLILENLFSEDEIKNYQLELERLRLDEDLKLAEQAITEPGSGEIRSIFKVHAVSRKFQQLMCDHRLAGLAQYLLNDEIYIHQSRVNYKPGFRGKEFYWHSDFETWHVEDGMPRMRALSMSIILTDNYEHNGPLMLIPGSHRRYVRCEGETPADHYRQSLKKQELGIPSDDCLARLVADGGIVTATGRPGSLIIFDCNTMHGSNGNITPFPRSNVFMVFNAMSNQVVAPFCRQPPRPEYICARNSIVPLRVRADKVSLHKA